MYWIILLFLLLPSIVWPADYYASPTGSGTACTLGSPCTFNTLMTRALAANDNLHLECNNIYRETNESITPIASGTPGNRITLKSYGTCYERQGTHTGGNGSASLTDANANFSSLGVQAGNRLFNLTNGSHCYVDTVSTNTLTCANTLSNTLDQTFNTGDRYEVENKPIVTHASVFTSGWTCSSGVCSHPVTMNPGRHVWFDGRSTNPMVHDNSGTCSQSAMAAAGVNDNQYCTTSNTLYVRTATNPATRWTKPGVEVVHLFGNQTTLLGMSNKHDWTIKDIAIEKVYGTPISWGSTTLTPGGVVNVTLQNVRLGQSQRRNCRIDLNADPPDPTKCYLLNTYQWMTGDDRGGQLLTMGSSKSPSTGVLVDGLLGHDCENNCISITGTQSFTGTIRNSELFNNNHSIMNTGFDTGDRFLTIENNTFHGCTTCWHTGGDGQSNHDATFRNNLVYDVLTGDNLKHFVHDGRSPDPFGLLIQDPGDYRWENNIIINGGHGVRMSRGDHIFTKNVIANNTNTGINANNTAKVKLNDNIIADNGTGFSSSQFQVGCQFTPCSSSIFQDNTSNNNKFSPPTGTNIGFISGATDENKTLAEWQTLTTGDSNSTSSADCFVNAAGMDYNLADGCNDITAKRGPFREITLASGTMQGSSIITTWNVGGSLPLTKCNSALANVVYGAAAQTEGACTANLPTGNQTNQAMPAAPAVGVAVTLDGNYGYVEDNTCIGGVNGACLNARSRDFVPTNITNPGGTGTTGWIQGGTRVIPSGSNRVLLAALCWEVQPVTTSPVSFTSCSYGGQAMTLVQSTTSIDDTAPANISNVHAAMWRLNELGIAAATNTTLSCTTSEAVNGARPFILTSGVYEGINQTTPVVASQVATLLDGLTLTTANLTTTGNPGVPVQLACSGNEGLFAPGTGWTEQIDICEDTACGTRMHVADRASAGQTNIHGDVAFSHEQTFPERLALVAIALNGGTVLPPEEIPVRTQTASRCAFHNTSGWQAPQDEPCTIVPGHQLAVVSEYTVTDFDEPAPVGKQMNCCWNNCSMPENFFAVDDIGANGVRYASSGLFPHGLPIDTRLLAGAACTHVPGAWITRNAMIPQALDVGECSTFAYILEIMSGVDPVAFPQLTCEMALDDNTPFASGAKTIINVKDGNASEGGGGGTTPPVCIAGGGWFGSKPLSGSEIVSPSSTTTYSLTCTGPEGQAFQSVTVTVATPPPDTDPPERSNPSGGSLPAGTTSTVLSLTTDEDATCRYSTVPDIAYADMTVTFSTTGGTSHSHTATGLQNEQSYAYFVRCIDTEGNANTTNWPLTYTVAADPALIAHYKLDGNPNDSATADGAQNGTLVNNPTYVTGQIGQGLQFGGTNYVNLGQPTVFNNLHVFSASGWINCNNTCNGSDTIVSQDDGTNRRWHLRVETVTTVAFAVYKADTRVAVSGTGFTITPAWHHVVGTYDGTNLRIYLDGVLKSTVANTGNVDQDASNAHIGSGATSGTTLALGLIDDVRIYNKALSGPEVTALYNAGISPPSDTTPPFRFNPSGGTLAAGTTSTILSLDTDEPATCKYATTDIAYGAMTLTFSSTGSTHHTHTVSGLVDGQSYAFYVHCQDAAGNATTTAFPLTYTVSSAAVKAFPSAEGWGKDSQGGRNGTVCHVSSLADSGTNTLRDCLTRSGARTVVFDTSGTITLTSSIDVTTPFLTIAGQTAPGNGIMVKGEEIRFKASHMIMRHFRHRSGPNVALTYSAGSISVQEAATNVIIDRSSFSWSADDIVGVGGGSNPTTDVTLQWSIVAEGIDQSFPPPDEASDFGKNVIIAGQSNRTSLLHNLLANSGDRLPNASRGDIQMVNNVMYNFRGGCNVFPSTGSGVDIEFLANRFLPGPDSGSAKFINAVGKDSSSVSDAAADATRIYLSGNIDPRHRANNTLAEDLVLRHSSNTTGSLPVVTSPLGFPAIASQTDAFQAYTDMLAKVGARVPVMDSVDTRILNEVQTGTGDTQISIAFVNANYPSITVVTRGAGYDTDADGMPDTWETGCGLNPSNAADRNNVAANGYTNLENYLNGVAGDTVPGGTCGASLLREEPQPEAGALSVQPMPLADADLTFTASPGIITLPETSTLNWSYAP